MDVGRVQKVNIVDEVRDSYLDYAMSVIISRALPDVRDGLKPVHRRILYSMYKLGLHANSKHLKCANVVGDVLGKYHPHGDAAVYDSLVRMAQDFSLRYPLIDGQGNFGSIDGDSAAAYRYTECRLTKIAEEMLMDIEKETVPFIPNYDGRYMEPVVLPTRIPQLLLNGSVGIAVGMATNIPPHNLTELAQAMKYLIDNQKNSTTEDLMKFIKGPDFPTGGFIYNERELSKIYSQGKGAILCRGKAEIVEDKKGKYQILITEITYQTNKSVFLENIVELIRDKKIEGIKDLRDESNKDGLRIIIELKNDASPQKVLNQLYKYTELQKIFHLNLLTLVDGIQPKILSLKSVLEEFIEFRKTIIKKRTEYDLKKAQERAHILEGLAKALKNIDAIISLIKKSSTKEEAKINLKKKFKLTDIQAEAILEMKLQALAGLERKKILEELEEKKKLIKDLEDILAKPKRILEIIKNELDDLIKNYPSERKTKLIREGISEFKEEDLIPEEEVVIILTENGYVKRVKPDVWKVQKRGGKGVVGAATKEEDNVKYFFDCNTHDNLIFFTNTGRAFQVKAYEIPESSRVARGQLVINFLNLPVNEQVRAIVAIPKKSPPKFLVLATKNGIIKKVNIDEFNNIRRSGIRAITLDENDDLRWVEGLQPNEEIMLITKFGTVIRFKEKDLRPMGRNAEGVYGIRLKNKNEVVKMVVISFDKTKKQELIMMTENGFGKRTDIKFYKIQRRGGMGIKGIKITSKNGNVISAEIINEENEELLLISEKGQVIKIPLKQISVLGRATQGVRIMRLDAGDKLASAVVL